MNTSTVTVTTQITNCNKCSFYEIKQFYPSGYKSKRKSKPKHKLARFQKPKKRKLPHQVWWDLGEDLEFVNEQDVKRFKACFVWYYMYAKKPKYINRSKTVEKYKLMFEKMNKMISEERYLEHLKRSL